MIRMHTHLFQVRVPINFTRIGKSDRDIDFIDGKPQSTLTLRLPKRFHVGYPIANLPRQVLLGKHRCRRMLDARDGG
jgi:hypothetical protein